jgi:hypothetical protein
MKAFYSIFKEKSYFESRLIENWFIKWSLNTTRFSFVSVTFWLIKFIRHLFKQKILFYILKIKFYDWWLTSIHTWRSCWVNFLNKCELTSLIIRHFISSIHAHTFYNLRTIVFHIIDRQWLFLSRSF